MDLLLMGGALCLIWWGLAVALHAGSAVAAMLQPAIRRRRETNNQQPPVSIVIPVNGPEPELETAFASAYEQSYPRFEVLISAAGETAPAIATARRVAARYPDVKTRFVCEDVRDALSPKLNNLVTPLAVAGHDLILVKDSNICLEREQLARFVRAFAPGVGLVVAVPVARGAENFSAEIERAFMNGYQGRLFLAASAIGLGFGHGKIMLFDRRAFANAGGVPAIAGILNEDHALSKALARIGLRTVFASEVIRQVLGKRRFTDIWNRQLRWMVCRRQTESLAYFGEPLCNGLLAAVAGAVGAAAWGFPGLLAFVVTMLFWFAIEALLVLQKGWGWSWRMLLASLCRELIVMGLWFWTFWARRIVWGGRVFEIRGRKNVQASSAS